MTAALAFEHLGKSFGKQTVLEDVSLQVAAGEFVGLIGANGAGKTTLIKLVLDFMEAARGDISIFGRAHTDPLARRAVAYLPERFNPPAFATGADFLRYLCELHACDYRPDAVATLLARLDLDPAVLTRPVRTYSKGMAQKLGLVACLAVQAPLLLLDEPMSGLDPKARALFKRELEAHRAGGGTLFFSTHLLNDVDQLCSRIAVLHSAKFVFVGTVREFCDRHASNDIEQAYLRCVAINTRSSATAGATSL